jgi:hypothetical protein
MQPIRLIQYKEFDIRLNSFATTFSGKGVMFFSRALKKCINLNDNRPDKIHRKADVPMDIFESRPGSWEFAVQLLLGSPEKMIP